MIKTVYSLRWVKIVRHPPPPLTMPHRAESERWDKGYKDK